MSPHYSLRGIRGVCGSALALALLVPSLGWAQATRTWVSGVGDDVNPCSRTAPCKTFAGAISKTAAGGEINAMDSGGFGAVSITKSITIDGSGTHASILSPSVNGIVVNAGPADIVVLRNLSINGAGGGLNGILFNSGGQLHLDKMTIAGTTNQGILFQPVTSSSLFVSHTYINRTGGAILVQPQAGGFAAVSLNNVSMHGNARGLRAEDRSSVTVRDSIATGNAANGFVAIAGVSPVDMTLENVISSRNGEAGIYAGTFATVRISNVTATQNNNGLQAVGGTLLSFGNNRVHGNFTANGAPTGGIAQQ